ncbi:thiaminase II, partial [Poseidonibacter ostreae]
MTITQNLIKNSKPYWDDYIKHEFVQQLANGTLKLENFQHYLKQ